MLFGRLSGTPTDPLQPRSFRVHRQQEVPHHCVARSKPEIPGNMCHRCGEMGHVSRECIKFKPKPDRETVARREELDFFEHLRKRAATPAVSEMGSISESLKPKRDKLAGLVMTKRRSSNEAAGAPVHKARTLPSVPVAPPKASALGGMMGSYESDSE
mmetsp:Transcript_65836/g.150846  ORF Transcript_65836/g.150846 Transcript_65836/m.150846 type:complete len:158 (-) Transcript_65836:33-506(-)